MKRNRWVMLFIENIQNITKSSFFNEQQVNLWLAKHLLRTNVKANIRKQNLDRHRTIAIE